MTKKGLEQEVSSLKSDVVQLKQDMSILVKHVQAIEKKKGIESPKKVEQVKSEHKTTPASFTIGIILIILGALLCMSIVGAVIGIPLLIVGIVLVSKDDHDKKKKAAPKQQVEKKPKQKRSFEEALGMKWFGGIGALALVIGIGFFIKYAIDNDWISHMTRIVLGVCLGIALIFGGELASKRGILRQWGQTLIGVGIAITYFAVYAAYHFPTYRMAIGISQFADIVLLIIVVLMAVLLSLKHNSEIICGFSFLLGYCTSLLSNSFESLTIVYGLLLTIGLVYVVCKKKWSAIGLGGVAASYGMFYLFASNNTISFSFALFSLLIYFIAFGFQSFTLGRLKHEFNLSTVVTISNTILFFIFGYWTVHSYYPDYTGVFCLALSVLYLLLYVIVHEVKTPLPMVYLYSGIAFLTITIPVQLNGVLVTVLWAVESVLLFKFFVSTKIPSLKVAAYCLAFFTALKTFTYDAHKLEAFMPGDLLGSTRLISFVFTIIAFYFIYTMMHRNNKLFNDEHESVGPVFAWLGSFFLVLLIMLELGGKHSLWITILWSALAAGFMLISSAHRLTFRYQSYILSLIVVLKVLIVDSIRLGSVPFSELFTSLSFYTYIITALCLFSTYRYLLKHPDNLNLTSLYTYAGSIVLFAFIALAFSEFGVSAGWIVLGVLLLMYGFSNNAKHFRIQGMIILSLTILKVFLYDTRNLEIIYRTLSYILLGVILLAVSFIYTKYKDSIKEIV